MRFPRYTVRVILGFTLAIAGCVWGILRLSEGDDSAKINRNGRISRLTRDLLIDCAASTEDEALRSFLGLRTSCRDTLSRESLGDGAQVELVAPLHLQCGSVWVVRNHSDACFVQSDFAAIIIDDGGHVKKWVLLAGLPSLDGFSRIDNEENGVLSETLAFWAESPVRKCGVRITISLTGDIVVESHTSPLDFDRGLKAILGLPGWKEEVPKNRVSAGEQGGE